MNQHTWRFMNVRDNLMNDTENVPLCDLLAYSMFYPTAEKIKERITSYQSSDTHIYACVENDVYLGLIVYRLRKNIATILDIAVRDDMRGQGVGTFLIDGLIQTTRTTEVLAETDDDAIGFYQNYGFRVTDIKTVYDRKRYMCRLTRTYTYTDYTPDFETVIDSWLDEDAAYYTGFENGFAVYYNYWSKEPNTVLGENFWMKVVLENSIPLGVVVLSLADDTVDFLEFLIDPAKRGQGIGTAVIGDVLKNGKGILGHTIDRAEACIYPSNVPS